eukprot:gb/GECH01012430.1/.p1 GENE.gb/GECH01012430.1/~~gb/GECH01012430.1/.p1  ORF type:complete len:277 (+),score=112.35 gb/GECH01012430.1/:1-831(+)
MDAILGIKRKAGPNKSEYKPKKVVLPLENVLPKTGAIGNSLFHHKSHIDKESKILTREFENKRDLKQKKGQIDQCSSTIQQTSKNQMALFEDISKKNNSDIIQNLNSSISAIQHYNQIDKPHIEKKRESKLESQKKLLEQEQQEVNQQVTALQQQHQQQQQNSNEYVDDNENNENNMNEEEKQSLKETEENNVKNQDENNNNKENENDQDVKDSSQTIEKGSDEHEHEHEHEYEHQEKEKNVESETMSENKQDNDDNDDNDERLDKNDDENVENNE